MRAFRSAVRALDSASRPELKQLDKKCPRQGQDLLTGRAYIRGLAPEEDVPLPSIYKPCAKALPNLTQAGSLVLWPWSVALPKLWQGFFLRAMEDQDERSGHHHRRGPAMAHGMCLSELPSATLKPLQSLSNVQSSPPFQTSY